MKITVAKLRKMVKYMVKQRIAPMEVYILCCGDKKFILPVSELCAPCQIIGVQFPIEVVTASPNTCSTPFELKMRYGFGAQLGIWKKGKKLKKACILKRTKV
jgi:hypothetical protein